MNHVQRGVNNATHVGDAVDAAQADQYHDGKWKSTHGPGTWLTEI